MMEMADWLRQRSHYELDDVFLNSKIALSCRKSSVEMADQLKILLICLPALSIIPRNSKVSACTVNASAG